MKNKTEKERRKERKKELFNYETILYHKRLLVVIITVYQKAFSSLTSPPHKESN